MSKIYIKLVDTSGSLFIATQGVSVNRNQIKEVERDNFIDKVIEGGGIVEVTKKDFDEYNADRNKKRHLHELEKLKPNKNSHTNDRTKTIILEKFEEMDLKGWEYAFLSKTDFDYFVQLLTIYFEHGIIVEKKHIEVRKRCRSKLGSTIGDIYSTLGETLKQDKDFLELVKMLSCFKGEVDKTIIQILQR